MKPGIKYFFKSSVLWIRHLYRNQTHFTNAETLIKQFLNDSFLDPG